MSSTLKEFLTTNDFIKLSSNEKETIVKQTIVAIFSGEQLIEELIMILGAESFYGENHDNYLCVFTIREYLFRACVRLSRLTLILGTNAHFANAVRLNPLNKNLDMDACVRILNSVFRRETFFDYLGYDALNAYMNSIFDLYIEKMLQYPNTRFSENPLIKVFKEWFIQYMKRDSFKFDMFCECAKTRIDADEWSVIIEDIKGLLPRY